MHSSTPGTTCRPAGVFCTGDVQPGRGLGRGRLVCPGCTVVPTTSLLRCRPEPSAGPVPISTGAAALLESHGQRGLCVLPHVEMPGNHSTNCQQTRPVPGWGDSQPFRLITSEDQNDNTRKPSVGSKSDWLPDPTGESPLPPEVKGQLPEPESPGLRTTFSHAAFVWAIISSLSAGDTSSISTHRDPCLGHGQGRASCRRAVT